MGNFKPAIPLVAALLVTGVVITIIMGLLHKRPVDDDLPFGDV